MNFRFKHNLKPQNSDTMAEIAIKQSTSNLPDRNWLDKLFDDDNESTKMANKILRNQKGPSQYYAFPEMSEMLRNRTAWIKIEDRWTHVKFQINGGNLQMLIL